MDIVVSDKVPGTVADVPSLSNWFTSWDGTGEGDNIADPSFAMDPIMMSNLLQSSFDDWTALDGPLSDKQEFL